ncbi:MAG: dTDP-glucose 4,6-dehydratase [Candidatus Omnitrophica bacterium]|nr:dTDP-glucose 4,6-dehydratase [Candidatus Omnitrophota bacterium]MCM8792957.1 dTDP-glucose 4,6-dehydratase [Candidatus Omnitrophota bacterium]
MEKILVTGGCGFIGSNFIRYILKKYPHYKIINLDKLTYAGNIENLRDIEKDPRYKFIKGDICDQRVVKKLLRAVDIVINFASETHVDRSLQNAKNFLKTNFYGTYVLLEAARERKTKLYLQISTDEVYGSRKEGFFQENSPLNPSNPYSISKASADLLVLSYQRTYKIPVIIARSSNNFGPYQYPEKIIPLFITNLLENKKVPLYGDGSNIRDWLYVLDNISAIDLLLHKGKPGEIYNIGGGNFLSNLQLAKILLKLLGKKEDFIQYVPDRPGHDFRYALDSTKIRNLGWKPKHNFLSALKETVEWYKKNKSWWKPLKKEGKKIW